MWKVDGLRRLNGLKRRVYAFILYTKEGTTGFALNCRRVRVEGGGGTPGILTLPKTVADTTASCSTSERSISLASKSIAPLTMPVSYPNRKPPQDANPVSACTIQYELPSSSASLPLGRLDGIAPSTSVSRQSVSSSLRSVPGGGGAALAGSTAAMYGQAPAGAG